MSFNSTSAGNHFSFLFAKGSPFSSKSITSIALPSLKNNIMCSLVHLVTSGNNYTRNIPAQAVVEHSGL